MMHTMDLDLHRRRSFFFHDADDNRLMDLNVYCVPGFQERSETQFAVGLAGIVVAKYI